MLLRTIMTTVLLGMAPLAASLPTMPMCAMDCFTAVLSSTDCYSDDFRCMCASPQFQVSAAGNTYATCVKKACSKSPAQIQDAKDYINFVCNIFRSDTAPATSTVGGIVPVPTSATGVAPLPTMWSGPGSTSNSTSSSSSNSSSDSSGVTPWIIGACVGGGVLVTIVVVFGAFMIRRRKREMAALMETNRPAWDAFQTNVMGVKSNPEADRLFGFPSPSPGFTPREADRSFEFPTPASTPRELEVPRRMYEVAGRESEVRHEMG